MRPARVHVPVPGRRPARLAVPRQASARAHLSVAKLEPRLASFALSAAFHTDGHPRCNWKTLAPETRESRVVVALGRRAQRAPTSTNGSDVLVQLAQHVGRQVGGCTDDSAGRYFRVATMAGVAEHRMTLTTVSSSLAGYTHAHTRKTHQATRFLVLVLGLLLRLGALRVRRKVVSTTLFIGVRQAHTHADQPEALGVAREANCSKN